MEITVKDFDIECYPNRCIKPNTMIELKRLKTKKVKKNIKTILGTLERSCFEVEYKGEEAFIDCMTGSIYHRGKCLSSDQLTTDYIPQASEINIERVA